MIPTSGLLKSFELTRRESRAAHRLPVCWEKVPGGGMSGARAWSAPPIASRVRPFVPLAGGRGGEAAEFFREGDTFLLMVSAHAPDGAVEAMLAAADRGARVYVLASPGFGEGALEHGLSQRRDARVLVRRLPGLPLSCAISQRGERAGVWLGATPGTASRWWLPLSVAQGEALFRVALHLFWHEAEEEAWTGGGPLRFQKSLERPFDVPLPQAHVPVRMLRTAPALDAAEGDTLYLSSMELPAGGPHRPGVLFHPSRPRGMERLAELARAGTQVCWEDLGLPAFHGNARTGVVEPSSGPWTLRLELEPAQAGALHQLALLAQEHATWKLRTGLPLSELRGEVWLPEAPTLQQRNDEVELGAGSVQAAVPREMPDCAPKQWPPPPELALNVTWRWKVQPPLQPVGASEAPLVHAWRLLDANVAQRLDEVRTRLDKADAQSGFLAKTFAALAGAVLGFGRAKKDLAQEAEELARHLPSTQGCEGARALLTKLSELEGRAEKLTNDLGQAEKKAREDQEREEQLKTFEQKRREAEARLAEARSERDDLLPQLAAKQEEKKQADEELVKSPKDKDLKARANLLGGECLRLDKKRRDVDSRLKGAEEILKQEFEFRPSRPSTLSTKEAQRPGKGFIPETPQSTADEVPSESLPSVGRLLQLKSERYLVISRWEELAQGECDAERLKARLVAPPEAA